MPSFISTFEKSITHTIFLLYYMFYKLKNIENYIHTFNSNTHTHPINLYICVMADAED